MNSIKLLFALILLLSTALMATTEESYTTISAVESLKQYMNRELQTYQQFCEENHFEYIYVENSKLIFKRNISTANQHRLYHKWTVDYDPIAGNLTDVHYQSSGIEPNDQNSLKAELGPTRTPYELVNSKNGSDAYWKPLGPGESITPPIPDSKDKFFRSIIKLPKTNEFWVIVEHGSSKDQYMYRLEDSTPTPIDKTVLKFFGCWTEPETKEMSMLWIILLVVFGMIITSVGIIILIVFCCRDREERKASPK